MQADIAEWRGKEVDRSERGVTCQERGKREEGKMRTQKKKQGQREIGGGYDGDGNTHPRNEN